MIIKIAKNSDGVIFKVNPTRLCFPY